MVLYLEYLGVSHLFIYTLNKGENLILELLDVFLWDIHLLKRGINVFVHQPKDSLYQWMLHLLNKISILFRSPFKGRPKEKDRDVFLLELLSLLPSPVQHIQLTITSLQPASNNQSKLQEQIQKVSV